MSVFVLGIAVFLASRTLPARAADSDFSNGITVDSKGDAADANVGDGICDDGDGNCTLHAAIQEANSNPDESLIKFNITGPADFTNNTQSGYIIKAGAGNNLPAITKPVTIDAYSQPGASANTAVSPAPFNGTLLIEVDNSLNPESNVFSFDGNSGGSTLKGLSIYGATDGTAIGIGRPVNLLGNYVGVDATGLVRKGNCAGFVGSNGGNSHIHTSAGSHIGGLNPEDRNIFSGNDARGCGFASGGYPDSGFVIQGNYVGLAADGVTAIPNSEVGGSGGFSVDDTSGVVIGGAAEGATNVFSGNNSIGLAPDLFTDLTIQGNLFGTDYTGLLSVPNHNGGLSTGTGTGLTLGGSASGAGNLSAYNIGDCIFLNGVTNAVIKGNTLHDCTQSGLSVVGMQDSIIGGSDAGDQNSITDNANDGLFIGKDSHDVTVQGNTISFNSRAGIQVYDNPVNILIGGTGANQGNSITDNTTSGIDLVSGVDGDPQNVSLLGNNIYNNIELGITTNSSLNSLPNDAGDTDAGPNDALNYPDNVTYLVVGGNTLVNYTLDVPAGDYRVEFFSNTVADGSGFGEGETFLASQNVSSDGAGPQNFSQTLTGVSVPNVSATATRIDSGQTSGFRMTSQFSPIAAPAPPVNDLSLTKTLSNPLDVAKGATLHYDLTLTNGGYSSIDLTTLDGSSPNPFASYVFLDLLPPELTYVSNNNPDITCTNTSTTITQLIAANHTDYNMIACAYTGSGQTLASGESITDTLNVTVNNDSDLVFTNYALAPAVDSDPDTNTIGTALSLAFGGGGSPDFIESMIVAAPNNFAAASFPLPVGPTPSPSSNGGAVASTLAQTGTNEGIWMLLAFSLLAGAGWLAVRGVKRSQS